jgi:hypothetical protein
LEDDVVSAHKLDRVLQALGAGVGAAAALGFINKAAHATDWGFGALCGAAGFLAAWSTLALVSKGTEARRSMVSPLANTLLLGALLLSATYLEGRMLWSGGAWLGASGAAGALALELAGLRRGRALRGLESCCLVLLCAGAVLARYGPWNAAIAGVAALLPPAAALLERRISADNEAGPDGASGVRCRLLFGLF